MFDISSFTRVPLETLLVGFLLMLLGEVTHGIKVTMKDKTCTFKSYFVDNWRQVAMSVIGGIVGYFVLIQMNELSLLAYFGVGYAAENVLHSSVDKASQDLNSNSNSIPGNNNSNFP